MYPQTYMYAMTSMSDLQTVGYLFVGKFRFDVGD